MAKYGARHIRWAKITDESAGAKPTYAAAIALAKLQKVTDSPAFNEAKQHGDDELAEHVAEFKEIGVDIEITDLTHAIYVAVYGAQTVAGQTEGKSGVAFTDKDTAPYGGLGFVCCKQVNNVKSYYGVAYPKLKAVPQGEEFTGKGDSITLTGGKMKFTGTTDKRGEWREFSEEFAEVEDAIEWVDGYFELEPDPENEPENEPDP